ncbi:MAG TPA: hypothetical protein EYP86_04790 [Candidatus Altiarchaeales archaeon]|nr:hypothetical protein [Candidatus Altiarchaeales archaeon]
MNVNDYAYPSARIRAMKGNLLDKTKIEELLRAHNLDEFVELLADTIYCRVFEGMGGINLRNIDRVLLDDLFDTHNKVFFMAPKNSQPLFFSMLMHYEIQCVKEIISSTISRKEVDTDKFPSRDPEFLRNLSKSDNLDEMFDLLKQSRYKKAFTEIQSVSDGTQILLALDKYFYDKLWRVLKSINNEIAKRILGPEFDFVNIMTLLRINKIGDSENRPKIDNYLVPTYKVRNIEKLISSGSIDEIVSNLSNTAYREALEEGLKAYMETKQLLKFEISLRKLLLQFSRKYLMGYPFQIGLLLGYLKLKESEIRNLRAIATGINHRLSSDDIKELIVI